MTFQFFSLLGYLECVLSCFLCILFCFGDSFCFCCQVGSGTPHALPPWSPQTASWRDGPSPWGVEGSSRTDPRGRVLCVHLPAGVPGALVRGELPGLVLRVWVDFLRVGRTDGPWAVGDLIAGVYSMSSPRSHGLGGGEAGPCRPELTLLSGMPSVPHAGRHGSTRCAS